jgi:alkylmercury lyase-like protein
VMLVARGRGADPDAVLAELTERDLIAFGAHGEIRAACPFSPAPTPIQVRWDGGPASYAMCAIDALGMSAMLGRPVTITAAEPNSGRIIAAEADRDRARWRPRTAVVFAGAADDACQASVGGATGTSTSSPVPGPHATGRAATLTSAGGCCAGPRR